MDLVLGSKYMAAPTWSHQDWNNQVPINMYNKIPSRGLFSGVKNSPINTDLINDLYGVKIMRGIVSSKQLFWAQTQSSKSWGSLHDLLSVAGLVKIPKRHTDKKLDQNESFIEIHQWFSSGFYWTFIHRNSKGTRALLPKPSQSHYNG